MLSTVTVLYEPAVTPVSLKFNALVPAVLVTSPVKAGSLLALNVPLVRLLASVVP